MTNLEHNYDCVVISISSYAWWYLSKKAWHVEEEVVEEKISSFILLKRLELTGGPQICS